MARYPFLAPMRYPTSAPAPRGAARRLATGPGGGGRGSTSGNGGSSGGSGGGPDKNRDSSALAFGALRVPQTAFVVAVGAALSVTAFMWPPRSPVEVPLT